MQPSAAKPEYLWGGHDVSPIPDREIAREREQARIEGFSGRLTLGMGWGAARRSKAPNADGRAVGTFEVSGLAGSITLDIGATLVENLVLFGRASGIAFNHVGLGDTANAGNGFIGLIGPGVRYHFPPMHWYVSGVLALAGVLATDDRNEKQRATPGFGSQLEAGMQWWVGNKFQKRAVAFGMRFDLVYAGGAGAIGGDWLAGAYSLVFSTAYN
ncbi:MAG: hypothetical protein ABW321_07930 [Polyangiales bacterium]